MAKRRDAGRNSGEYDPIAVFFDQMDMIRGGRSWRSLARQMKVLADQWRNQGMSAAVAVHHNTLRDRFKNKSLGIWLDWALYLQVCDTPEQAQKAYFGLWRQAVAVRDGARRAAPDGDMQSSTLQKDMPEPGAMLHEPAQEQHDVPAPPPPSERLTGHLPAVIPSTRLQRRSSQLIRPPRRRPIVVRLLRWRDYVRRRRRITAAIWAVGAVIVTTLAIAIIGWLGSPGGLAFGTPDPRVTRSAMSAYYRAHAAFEGTERVNRFVLSDNSDDSESAALQFRIDGGAVDTRWNKDGANHPPRTIVLPPLRAGAKIEFRVCVAPYKQIIPEQTCGPWATVTTVQP